MIKGGLDASAFVYDCGTCGWAWPCLAAAPADCPRCGEDYLVAVVQVRVHAVAPAPDDPAGDDHS